MQRRRRTGPKSRAEIQKAYRERLKAQNREKYLAKERERRRKMYVPLSRMPRKEREAFVAKRREYIKNWRLRKQFGGKLPTIKSEPDDVSESRVHEERRPVVENRIRGYTKRGRPRGRGRGRARSISRVEEYMMICKSGTSEHDEAIDNPKLAKRGNRRARGVVKRTRGRSRARSISGRIFASALLSDSTAAFPDSSQDGPSTYHIEPSPDRSNRGKRGRGRLRGRGRPRTRIRTANIIASDTFTDSDQDATSVITAVSARPRLVLRGKRGRGRPKSRRGATKAVAKVEPNQSVDINFEFGKQPETPTSRTTLVESTFQPKSNSSVGQSDTSISQTTPTTAIDYVHTETELSNATSDFAQSGSPKPDTATISQPSETNDIADIANSDNKNVQADISQSDIESLPAQTAYISHSEIENVQVDLAQSDISMTNSTNCISQSDIENVQADISQSDIENVPADISQSDIETGQADISQSDIENMQGDISQSDIENVRVTDSECMQEIYYTVYMNE